MMEKPEEKSILGTDFEQVLLKQENLDTVEGAFAYRGGKSLDKPGLANRERIQIDLVDEMGKPIRWYMKRYGSDSFFKRLGRWIIGKGRSSPARREYENIHRLSGIGIPTMRAITFGEERDFLGVRRSYLIVSAVPGEALERCFDDYFRRINENLAAIEKFNQALVNLIRKLHDNGLVHRDLYASHIFLDATNDDVELYLIDLARVFAPVSWRRFRWRVKDLAELKYSMPSAWVERYWDDFLKMYLSDDKSFLKWSKAIDKKVAWMLRRQRRKELREGIRKKTN